MKIVYLHQYFNTPSMYGGQRSYNFSQSLADNGHEVTVITSARNTNNLKIYTTNEGRVRIIWIPVKYHNSFSYLSRIFAFLSFTVRASIQILKIKCDLVFATSTPLTIAVPALIKKKFHKTNFIFEVRDLWPELPIAMGALKNKFLIKLARLLEKKVYRDSSCIIALSEGMKEGVLSLGVDDQRVAVIPNISDSSKFTELDIRKKISSKRIIYAGALGHINNIKWICNFSDHLFKYDQEIVVQVYGDGAMNEVLNHYSSQNTNNLIFSKPLPKEEIFQEFAKCTYSIISFNDLPEMRKNSSNKFFDSLASSTPVIINFGGWIHEIVEEYELGYSSWEKDLDQFCKMIVSELRDEDKYILKAKKCRIIADKNFSKEIACKKFNKVVSRTLANNFEIKDIADGNIIS